MYTLTHSSQIDINTVEAGNLVAQVLKEDFEFISREVTDLRYKRDLKAFEAEDLKNNIEMRDAMKTLLRYYMKHKEYIEFMELQRVYGNVD